MTDAQKAKRKASQDAYKDRNKEKLLEKARAYYWSNLETCKARSAEYHAENPGRVKEKRVEARQRDPEATKKTDKLMRERYKEKRTANFAKWYATNIVYAREFARIYRKQNLVKVKKSASDWYYRNQAQQTKRAKIYRLQNLQIITDKQAAYRKVNPEKSRVYCQNRRSRRKQVGGTLSPGIAKLLFKLQKGKCVCCEKPLGKTYHLDHIIPLALGGTNTDDNIQLLTARCNMTKGSKHPIDWAQTNGRLC